eukprot:355096-Chlamydomonas_euryale.AAC.8
MPGGCQSVVQQAPLKRSQHALSATRLWRQHMPTMTSIHRPSSVAKTFHGIAHALEEHTVLKA